MGNRTLFWFFPARCGVLFALFFLYCNDFVVRGQLPNLVKGSIVDSVKVGGSVHDSFALYLPRNFRRDELSPVLFIFDPAARGREGIKPFLAASEKYGFILVCSNNSKNGPYEANYKISNRLFKKVLKDFNVDPKRIYTAGFSGGARLASSIAVLSGQIQGVVACGAGFSPNEMAIEPDFSYAAIVGSRDFNYSELLRTQGWLDKLGFPNELFEYGIRHQWPDTTQVLKAFKWLQLEAYRTGVQPRDPAEIMTYYRDFYQDAKKFMEQGELVLAFGEYERILRNFQAYFELDSIQQIKERLSKGKAYRQQQRLRLASLETEKELIRRYYKRLSENLTQVSPDISWWENELARLKSRNNQADQFRDEMKERLLSTIAALSFETANNKAEVLTAKQQIFCYDLCILVFPDQLYPYIRLIELEIREGEMDKAIYYLEKLLESGYDDLEFLKNHKALQPLKTHRRFHELLPP